MQKFDIQHKLKLIQAFKDNDLKTIREFDAIFNNNNRKNKDLQSAKQAYIGTAIENNSIKIVRYLYIENIILKKTDENKLLRAIDKNSTEVLSFILNYNKKHKISFNYDLMVIYSDIHKRKNILKLLLEQYEENEVQRLLRRLKNKELNISANSLEENIREICFSNSSKKDLEINIPKISSLKSKMDNANKKINKI